MAALMPIYNLPQRIRMELRRRGLPLRLQSRVRRRAVRLLALALRRSLYGAKVPVDTGRMRRSFFARSGKLYNRAREHGFPYPVVVEERQRFIRAFVRGRGGRTIIRKAIEAELPQRE